MPFCHVLCCKTSFHGHRRTLDCIQHIQLVTRYYKLWRWWSLNVSTVCQPCYKLGDTNNESLATAQFAARKAVGAFRAPSTVLMSVLQINRFSRWVSGGFSLLAIGLWLFSSVLVLSKQRAYSSPCHFKRQNAVIAALKLLHRKRPGFRCSRS